MSGLLGLSYEHEEDEEEEEEEPKKEEGGLVAYDHEEEEEEGEGEGEDVDGENEERSTSPHKRRRVEDDEEQRDDEGDQNGAVRDDDEEAEESSRMEQEENDDHKADFEDQSLYARDGRSLMELMLPPRPARPPDASLQGKIVQFHRLRREGRAKSINEKIRHARNFKNPYMLNWLVSHCGIDETGSNYPKQLFDPAAIRREAAEVMERQKRQKAAAQQNRTAIDFTTGEGAGSAGLQAGGGVAVVPGGATAAVGLGMPRPVVKVVEGTKRPRSKWDQGEPAAGAKPGATQPAATVTTTSSGSRYAEYALAKKAEIEAKLRQK